MCLHKLIKYMTRNFCNKFNVVNKPTDVEDTPSVADCLKKTIPTYNLKQITDLKNSDLQTVCKFTPIILSTQCILDYVC